MRLRSTRVMLLSLCLLPLLGGCAEGDEVTVTSETVSINLRGTDARDTLDLNIGTNAGFNSDSNAGFFSGPDGQILMLFKQQHETPDGFGPIPEALTQPFNYARVLADTPGPIMTVDDHTDPSYENNIDFMRQSWNLRYVALLNEYQADNGEFRLKLVVWDFVAGEFTTVAHVASSNFFGRAIFSSPFLSARDLFVDNNGRVTVLFQAIDPASPDDTDRALWTVQYGTSTQQISRGPTIISGPFLVAGESQNSADYFDGRMTANGDIALLFHRTDNYGGAAAPDFRSVLHSVVYKAAGDTWGAATRADNGVDDRFGAPVASPSSLVLDTDANSFQYAFIQNSDSFGNLPSVYTSRFVASTGTAFPLPTRIDTTTAVGLHRVANPQFGGVDIHFGRNGASLVHWVQTETGQGAPIDTIWMSHSNNTVAPAPANSAELLDASMPAHAGYSVAVGRASITVFPGVAFDDAGNAIMTFVAFNATSNAEVYAATFNGTSITPATVGTDNLATLPAVGGGQTRFIDSTSTSGFSGGANPRCVVTWTAELRGGNGNLISASAWALAFNGLAPAGAAALIHTSTTNPFQGQFGPLSSNRFSTNGKILLGIGDNKIRTDEYPAYGTGTVWLLNPRLTPSSTTYEEIRIASFNPAVHTNVVANGQSASPLGQFDNAEGLSLLSDGSLDFAFGVFGLHYQRSYVPSAAASADPFASAAQLLTPPDMKQVSPQFPQGLHMDGMNFVRTASGGGVTSVLVNVPRRWTLWMANDTKSQRLFGVRSR